MMGWVFLAHDAGTGLYRLGWAYRLSAHLKALAVHSVGDFRLVAYVFTNDTALLERHLRAAWAGKLVGEKWYRLDPDDVTPLRVTAAVDWKDTEPLDPDERALDPLAEPTPARAGARRPPVRLGQPIATWPA
jgi:hypothetical protein